MDIGTSSVCLIPKSVVFVFVIAVKLDGTDSSVNPIYTVLPYVRKYPCGVKLAPSLSLVLAEDVASGLVWSPYRLIS